MPYFWLKTDPEFKREWDRACYLAANKGSANAIKALNRILSDPNAKDSDKIQAAKVILDVDGKRRHRVEIKHQPILSPEKLELMLNELVKVAQWEMAQKDVTSLPNSEVLQNPADLTS